MPTPVVPLDAIRQPALLFDAGGRIVAANDLAEALAGRALVGLSTAEVREIFRQARPDGTPLAPADLPSCRALAGGEVIEEALAMRAADGRTLDVLVTASPVRDGDAVTGALVLWYDVTGYRRAEESEARLAALMDHNPCLVFLKDEQGRYVYLNETYERQFVHDPDWRGKTDFDFWPAESAELFRANDRDVLATGRTHQFLEDSTDRAGTRYCWLNYKFPFTDARGERYVGGIGIDATALVRAEEALREGEEKYQALIDANVDFIWETDARGRYTYCSPQMERLWGFTPDEMVGRTLFDQMPPAERERMLAVFEGMAPAPAEVRGLEATALDARGRLVSIEISAVPFFGDDGALLGYRGVTRDVTKRTRAEAALAQSEEEYRQIVEYAPTGIYEIDYAGPTFRRVNDAMCRILGYTREELLGMDPGAFLDEESRERFRERVQKVLAGEPVDESVTFRLFARDGREIWAALNVRPTVTDGRPDGALVVAHDITERMRMEEALRETAARYREALDSPLTGYALCEIVTGPDGTPTDFVYLDVNSTFEAFTGLPAERVLHRRVTEVLEPGEVAEVIQIYGRVALSGEPTTFRYPIPSLGKWFEVAAFSPRRGQFIAFFTDITERKRTDAALAASETRYRELVEQAGSIIIRYDLEGRITYANEFAQRFFGYGADELAGRHAVGTIIPGTDSAGRDLAEMVGGIVGSLEQYAENENENVRKNGERVRVRWTNRPIVGADGTVREFLAIGMDVTAARQAEEALAGVNRILAAALASETEEALGGVCLAVAEGLTRSRFGLIGELNEAGLQEIAISDPGWDACTVMDPSGHRRPPGEFALRGLFGRVLGDGKSLIANDPASHPDAVGTPPGHPALTAFLGVPLRRDEETVGILGVANREGGYTEDQQRSLEAIAPAIVDAFDRFRAGQDLRRYAADLERSNEDLERFAYVSSHDLQEPLRSIVSFSQLLDRRYRGQLDADADEYIDFIVEGGNRMQALIQDLLAYSRVNTTQEQLHPTDMKAVMASVERHLEVQLREAGAALTRDPLPTVTADPLQLEQVLSNLVSNAIKFRRPDVPLRIHVGARRTYGFWEFSVADNGIGIEKEYFEKIFVIFKRLHTKDAYPGTGIGLAIVKRIVDRHGGTIRVESTPGEGTTFYFTLPAA